MFMDMDASSFDSVREAIAASPLREIVFETYYGFAHFYPKCELWKSVGKAVFREMFVPPTIGEHDSDDSDDDGSDSELNSFSSLDSDDEEDWNFRSSENEEGDRA